MHKTKLESNQENESHDSVPPRSQVTLQLGGSSQFCYYLHKFGSEVFPFFFMSSDNQCNTKKQKTAQHPKGSESDIVATQADRGFYTGFLLLFFKPIGICFKNQ